MELECTICEAPWQDSCTEHNKANLIAKCSNCATPWLCEHVAKCGAHLYNDKGIGKPSTFRSGWMPSPRGNGIENTIEGWKYYANLIADTVCAQRVELGQMRARVSILEQKLEKAKRKHSQYPSIPNIPNKRGPTLERLLNKQHDLGPAGDGSKI